MKNIRMGFDLDGVLVDFGKHYLEYFDFEDKSDPTKWNDPRFSDYKDRTINDKNFWLTIPQIISHIELPVKPHCYVTARPIPNEWSMEWLWSRGFPYAPLVTVGTEGSKVGILKKIGVDVFIDDAIHNYNDLMSNDIPCLLMSRSHNLEQKTDLRVNSMRDVPKVLNNIFKDS